LSYFSFQADQARPISKLSLQVGQEAPPILLRPSGQGDGVQHLVLHDERGVLLWTESTAHPTIDHSRTLALFGRTPGSGSFIAGEVQRTAPMVAAARLEADISLPVDRAAELIYFGKHICWYKSLPSSGPLVFPATSGLPGHQIALFQKEKDHGPVPEGLYVVQARMDAKQSTHELANRLGDESTANMRTGIQALRIGGNGPVDPNWGTFRVRLEPIEGNMYGRGGFYLHNSQKGFSHGCIEIGRLPGGSDFF